MTEAQLISNVLAGERNDFNELVERYLPMVRGVCRSHVYDPAAEDDLVQDALLEGYRKLPTLRNRERFGPWLAAIARNKCKNWLRGQSRRATAYKRVAEEGPHATEPMGLIARQELYAWVREQIAGLPDKTREAMLLHYVEGASVAEAARFLGISETAVKQRLFYGRQRIAGHLWGELGEKAERADDSEELRRRVMAALPELRPAASPVPAPLAVTLSLAVFGAAVIAAITAFMFTPVATETATADVAPAEPRLRILAPEMNGVPAAPLADVPVRIAPQAFNREPLEIIFLEIGADPSLWDVLVDQFTDAPAWNDYINDPALPAAERQALLTAADRLALLSGAYPADMTSTFFETVFPPPEPEAWETRVTGPEGHLNLSGLGPGVYTIDVGDALDDPPPPWANPNRFRVEIAPGEMVDGAITLAAPIAEPIFP